MSSLAATASVTLNNEVTMPALGFGLFRVPESAVKDTVAQALAAGYRSFDTAPMYGNEQSLGHVLSGCGLDRGELFVTTKISTDDHGYQSTLNAFGRTAVMTCSSPRKPVRLRVAPRCKEFLAASRSRSAV